MHLFWEEEEGWQGLFTALYRAWELIKAQIPQQISPISGEIGGKLWSIFFKGSTSNSDVQSGLEATGGLWEYLI